MALLPSALDTLTQITLAKFRKGKFNEIVTPYSKYVFFGDLLRSKLKMYDGGYQYESNLMVELGANAGAASMYGTYNLDAEDTNKRIVMPERTWRTGWIMDDKELSVNAGSAEKLVDIVVTKEKSSEIQLANLMERQCGSHPADNTDTETMWGLPYWIVWHSGASGSFAGGHPSGWSDVAGLSSTTYPNWNNWDDTYVNMTEDDLFDKWREANEETEFTPPVEIPEHGVGYDFAYYVNLPTKLEMMRFTRGQNQNLGLEVAKGPGNGTPVFYGAPIRYVPLLKDTAYFNAAALPIYGINWKTMFWICLNGWNMKRMGPMRKADQPTVQFNYTFTSANMGCDNRRKNYVLAISQPAV